MAARRRVATSDEQTCFVWADPADLLASARGRVVFEAPETSRIVRGRAPRVPRVRVRAPAELESLGLPFGRRVVSGRVTCWSCGGELMESELVGVGPGLVACPGCGARLPFSD